MTINDSMNGKAFEAFIESFLVPKLGAGAVVGRNNLPADKMASIAPIIEAFGANIINLSRYYPDFKPFELWWSQLIFSAQAFSNYNKND